MVKMRKIKFFILTYLFSLSLTPAYGQTDNKELDNFYNSLYSILRETDKNITEFTIDTLSTIINAFYSGEDRISLIQQYIDNRNRIICVGNRNYMQFTDFICAADTSELLRALFNRNRLQIIDPDSIPDSYEKYLYAIKLLKRFPTFFIVDNEGALLTIYSGYYSPEKLVAAALCAVFIPDGINQDEIFRITQKRYKKHLRRSKSYERWLSMVSAGRHIDVNLGYGLYSLSGNNSQEKSSGMLSADIGFRQDIGEKKRVSLGTGITLEHVFDTNAQTRLSLPLEAELTILRWYPAIKCRAGIWGGRTFVREECRHNYNRYEAGVQCSLFLEFGNFDFSLGYKRGLTDILTAPDLDGYSNSLLFSTRLRLFK